MDVEQEIGTAVTFRGIACISYQSHTGSARCDRLSYAAQSCFLQNREEIMFKDLPGTYEVVHPYKIINKIKPDPQQGIERVGELIELHRFDADRRGVWPLTFCGLREQVERVGQMLQRIVDIPIFGQ